MNSVWSETVSVPHFEAQSGDIKTDALIIGGGLAGVLCSYMLTQSGVDCILVEKDSLCSGVTKNTTAKITSQHGLVYDKLIREFGAERAQMYLRANQRALEEYRKLCRNIDCDFKNEDSFVYSLNNRKKLEKELSALHKIGFDARFCEKVPLPMSTVGAVKFPAQAQFNPLKFVSAIVKGLKIYENTLVREIADCTAVTNHGKIVAEKIIVATHFPFINKHGGYYVKMYQERSYITALENAPQPDGMYVDENDKGKSFRNYGNLLLLGGGGHRTGKKGGGWRELEDFAQLRYPDSSEKYRWATQDCMTLDGVPYIGQYSKNTPDFYVATGFNKWGMTSSMVSASILTDMITGRENEYAPVFSPSRTILRTQLAVNAVESVFNLITPSPKRCPHLGCALKWNAQEHSWDCPCHGSRFAPDGRLLDNPATGDIKQKN
ncbi:MAG: FAD-dependent oxidoreductase [Clostridiales bacterium]|jgi:glycine/D-amino acid oxidase-like deaminating enzyme|nr:FAD-dependent oxidoreductase [Clostridiales bacterium]